MWGFWTLVIKESPKLPTFRYCQIFCLFSLLVIFAINVGCSVIAYAVNVNTNSVLNFRLLNFDILLSPNRVKPEFIICFYKSVYIVKGMMKAWQGTVFWSIARNIWQLGWQYQSVPAETKFKYINTICERRQTLISIWCLSSASSISLSLLRNSAFFSSSWRFVISQNVLTLSLSSWK